MAPRLALKVDVDTYSGTLEGIPRLLDLFGRECIRATFFFSLGPDNTGKAMKRVFKKGFVKKVLRASPAASYGVRTMLYGTLLPAPDIGAKPGAIARMREVKAAGHAIGIHAWDHVDWHDRLARMERPEVEATIRRAHARFEDVLGEKATMSAAPGWTATPLSVEVQEELGISITSDTRGGSPFHALRRDGRPSSVLEVPSTLPTLDELLALDTFGVSAAAREGTTDRLLKEIQSGPRAAVHSVHTEIEGGKALHDLFRRQVSAWKAAGVSFVTIPEVAGEALSSEVPARPLRFVAVPGRAIPVATGFDER